MIKLVSSSLVLIAFGCVLVSSNVILQNQDELRAELKGEEIENVETDRSFIPSNGWIYRNPIFPKGLLYPNCANTNGEALDKHDDGCDWYDLFPGGCGKYDDDDFKSQTMCCACQVCTVKDNNTCLQNSPDWGSQYDCSGRDSNRWRADTGYTYSNTRKDCEEWGKDMRRCCPLSCGIMNGFSKEECEAFPGKGTCTYPSNEHCTIGGLDFSKNHKDCLAKNAADEWCIPAFKPCGSCDGTVYSQLWDFRNTYYLKICDVSIGNSNEEFICIDEYETCLKKISRDLEIEKHAKVEKLTLTEWCMPSEEEKLSGCKDETWSQLKETAKWYKDFELALGMIPPFKDCNRTESVYSMWISMIKN